MSVKRAKNVKVTKSGEHWALNVQLHGERKDELDCLRYLGVDPSSDGGMEKECKYGLGESQKVAWALKNV